MLRSLVSFRRTHSLRPLDPLAMHCLHERERFHALVHRERARSDRSGNPFALVTFRLPRHAASRKAVLRLARTALRRSRVTDDVGWFDKSVVGALLPETSAEGAWHYVEGVVEAFDKSQAAAVRPEVTVFSYPTNWFNRKDDEDSSGQIRQPVRKPVGSKEKTPAAMPAPAAASTASLEPLLVKRLPLSKRLVDIVVATMVLLVASPLMIIAALAVKFTSRGPIIFRQRRAGLGGQPFMMYKFRSMYIDAEARFEELRARSEVDGPVFKMTNDPRVTAIGRWIRKTSVDELPQLFNVLKGEMSLVGPRPPIIKETEEYQSWQYRRLEVTPGLTCIWQVSGRSGISFDQWMRMDADYALKQSLWMDITILLKTIPAVLFGRGAY